MELLISEIEPERKKEQITEHFNFVNTERKWYAFFGAIRHLHMTEIHKIWDETDKGLYVVSKEISSESHQDTDGEHFHFVAEMTPIVYHAFSKRLFKDRFNLRGVAKDGLSRQYGKVKEIKDINRMIAYSLKDGDYITNISDDEIDRYKLISFAKIEKPSKVKTQTFVQNCAQILEKKNPDYNFDFVEDHERIIDVILDQLGDLGKVFDEHMIKKFYLGCYNILRKTERQKKFFRQRIMMKVYDLTELPRM
jgi:hypothetical protein